MSDTLTFDVALFRIQFPVFANVTQYPEPLLQMYWDNATCYVDDENCGYLQGSCRQLAINQMTAHLTALADLYNSGELTSLPTNATIDKITVGLLAPPERSQWQWWLNQTPYGQQLLALLQANAVGGFNVGALPERSGFRKIGGIF